MAPQMEMNEDTLLLLHIIHKDNPTLSGGNWPAVSAKMGQPADRIRKRSAAMRKEFLELGNDTTTEAPAPRKRGRPAKNTDGEAKPKAKRAKTAGKPNGDESAGSGNEAADAPAAAAPAVKKPRKSDAKKEDVVANEDEA